MEISNFDTLKNQINILENKSKLAKKLKHTIFGYSFIVILLLVGVIIILLDKYTNIYFEFIDQTDPNGTILLFFTVIGCFLWIMLLHTYTIHQMINDKKCTLIGNYVLNTKEFKSQLKQTNITTLHEIKNELFANLIRVLIEKDNLFYQTTRYLIPNKIADILHGEYNNIEYDINILLADRFNKGIEKSYYGIIVFSSDIDLSKISTSFLEENQLIDFGNHKTLNNKEFKIVRSDNVKKYRHYSNKEKIFIEDITRIEETYTKFINLAEHIIQENTK